MASAPKKTATYKVLVGTLEKGRGEDAVVATAGAPDGKDLIELSEAQGDRLVAAGTLQKVESPKAALAPEPEKKEPTK